GPLPWRLLAYLLKLSPDVAKVRSVIRKRLMDEPRIKSSEKALDQMLLTLAAGGYVILEPPPERPDGSDPAVYSAQLARPTANLDKLLVFRSAHPLYGAFLLDQLSVADRNERVQAMESILQVPRPLLRYLRVPRDLPPGPLATTRLDD